MREILKAQGYSQIPQLTSSRMVDVNKPLSFAPTDSKGTKRAVLIGINYVGQEGELSGCHNDAMNMKEYLMDVHGFKGENMTILLDDGVHIEPTRENILNAYKALVQASQAGDVCFCHYSGHGGRLRDENGDEEDQYDETLIPVDYAGAGQIRDDDLYKIVVAKMPQGVTLTCLMDCCHSGTVLDLPFKFVADGESTEMSFDGAFNMAHLENLANLAGILLNSGVSGLAGHCIDEVAAGNAGCCNVL